MGSNHIISIVDPIFDIYKLKVQLRKFHFIEL